MVNGNTNYTECVARWQENHRDFYPSLQYPFGNLTGLTDGNGVQVSNLADARAITYLACLDKDHGCAPTRKVGVIFSAIRHAENLLMPFSEDSLVGFLATVLFVDVALASSYKPASFWC